MDAAGAVPSVFGPNKPPPPPPPLLAVAVVVVFEDGAGAVVVVESVLAPKSPPVLESALTPNNPPVDEAGAFKVVEFVFELEFEPKLNAGAGEADDSPSFLPPNPARGVPVVDDDVGAAEVLGLLELVLVLALALALGWPNTDDPGCEVAELPNAPCDPKLGALVLAPNAGALFCVDAEPKSPPDDAAGAVVDGLLF